MTRVILALAAVLTVASPAAAQLSPTDRDTAAKYLQETRQKFLASIDGVSEAQWKFKPGPDRWSIAETAEHIALSEQLILGLITEKVVKAPPAAADAKLPTDQTVIDRITDRSGKAQAPEFLKPSNKWADRPSLTKDFNAARDKTIEYVKSTPEDLRAHAVAHPALGPIDALQWIILVSAHSARHTAQIEEVKASPGYPAK